MYVLASSAGQAVLLHSTDGGQTFTAYPIPGRKTAGAVAGHRAVLRPQRARRPAADLRYTRTAADPSRIWRRINDLELLLPEKTDAGHPFGEPILRLEAVHRPGRALGHPVERRLARREGPRRLGRGDRAGRPRCPACRPTWPPTTARRRRWASRRWSATGRRPTTSTTRPASRSTAGAICTCWSARTAGRSRTPDRSQPNDAGSGWTEPVPAGEGLPQTYIGLVCGPDDTLHLVFRLWRSGEEPFPASQHATLAYQRKRPGQPWEPPRVLVVPPFSEYSVYYHRLTIDRRGRLFLSYDYWSTYWFYRNDHPGGRRAVMMSPDGGDTWKLAEDRDL